MLYERATLFHMKTKVKREQKQQAGVRLEVRQIVRIQALAETERRLFSDMLRVLIDEALTRREEKKR